jgi:lipopolysaccharide transport system ATP-binding protein
LLEVGTGFHPELTGRENIFFNGVLLGMSKREVAGKFDEIVAFSEVERFLDTPVKFYSSGMYVRLAFAVAAHLEPDILIVDEVLSVGDASFQRKSLGKMRDSTRSEGRTVLFVSHNLGAIQSLCSRVVVLDHGRVTCDDAPTPALAEYLRSSGEPVVEFDGGRAPKQPLVFTRLELLNERHHPTSTFAAGEPVLVRILFDLREPRDDLLVGFELWNEQGVCVLTTNNFDADLSGRHRTTSAGSYSATCALPTDVLPEGRYYLTIASARPNVEMLDQIENAAAFELMTGPASLPRTNQTRRGVVEIAFPWELAPIPYNVDV